jgi:hypothetical protein
MLRKNIGDESPHLGFVGDIDDVTIKPRAVCPRCALQAIEFFPFPIRDHHGGPLFEEGQTHRPSQSSRATGYQGYLP